MADVTSKKEEIQNEIRIIENNPSVVVKSIDLPESQKDLKGDHFGSSVVFMNVTLTRNGSGKEEIIPIFIKRKPENAPSSKDNETNDTFKKEGEWYKTISKKMIGFCDETAPAIGQKLKQFFPVCYYTDADFLVVMEDLNKQNFQMPELNLDVMQDINQVKLVMDFFGVFHGIGYVMKKRNLMSDIVPLLNEIFLSANGFLPMFIDAFFKSVLPHFEKEEKYHNILTKFIELGAKVVDEKTKPCEPFTTMNHGDSANNNMLFKYGEDGKATGVKMVDWQCTRYCSMTVDLNYYLFTSTTTEFKKKHLEEVLKYYYNNFTKTVLELTGEKSFEDFSFSDLYEDFKSRNIVGLLMMTMAMVVQFTPKRSMKNNADVDTSLFDNFLCMSANVFNYKGNAESMKKLLVAAMDEIGENLLRVLK